MVSFQRVRKLVSYDRLFFFFCVLVILRPFDDSFFWCDFAWFFPLSFAVQFLEERNQVEDESTIETVFLSLLMGRRRAIYIGIAFVKEIRFSVRTNSFC